MSTKILPRFTKQTFVVKSSTKGQVVIPKAIRDYLQIDENTKLVFSFDDKQVFLSKQDDDIDSVFGSLKSNSSNQKITQTQFEKDLEKAKSIHFKAKSD